MGLIPFSASAKLFVQISSFPSIKGSFAPCTRCSQYSVGRYDQCICRVQIGHANVLLPCGRGLFLLSFLQTHPNPTLTSPASKQFSSWLSLKTQNYTQSVSLSPGTGSKAGLSLARNEEELLHLPAALGSRDQRFERSFCTHSASLSRAAFLGILGRCRPTSSGHSCRTEIATSPG